MTPRAMIVHRPGHRRDSTAATAPDKARDASDRFPSRNRQREKIAGRLCHAEPPLCQHDAEPAAEDASLDALSRQPGCEELRKVRDRQTADESRTEDARHALRSHAAAPR